MKIYISGKITGLPIQVAYLNFQKSENELKKRGYEPVNPMKLNEVSEGKTWQDYMLADIAALFDCDAIFMQKNWRKSKGARIERAIARELNLVIFYEKNLKKIW